jgi:tubulin polyglutamylase TTLL7
MLSNALKNFFGRYNIQKYDDYKYDDINDKKVIYIPCLYDNTDMEIENMPKTINNYYMVINKCDTFVGKNYLWIYTNLFYPKDKVLSFMPNSYLTYDSKSMDIFKNEFSSDKLYILKKNIQRQAGIKIFGNYDDIIKALNNDKEYIIIQELLQNPFLVNGRKINLRVYFLLVIKDDDYSVYVYDNGFMYYTPNMFKKGSTDIDTNVTTGYIDRKVYEENPLTHDDFKTFLGKEKTNIVFQNIRILLKNVMEPFRNTLVNMQPFRGSTQFQIFGSDVAVNDDLTATLMEINKGPDLNPKDERDGALKTKLMDDVFATVGVIKGDGNNRFIRV